MTETAEAAATIVTTVRIPAHVHEAITKVALLNRRSVNQQIVTAIENNLAQTRFAGKSKAK